MTRTINLTRGLVTIVDDADYESLAGWSWYALPSGRTHYAVRTMRQGAGGILIAMHRFLMLPDPGDQIDHINGDGLDNRRTNLRPCSNLENRRNQKAQLGATSRYKGVHWHKRNLRWTARIRHDGKLHDLGSFRQEVDAALAYDLAAIDSFGPVSRTNFLCRQES